MPKHNEGLKCEVNWGSDRKRQAREFFIKKFREEFCDKIPKGMQYWTMCGQCTEKDGYGEIADWCEYDHIVNRARFASHDQFVGVEVNEKRCRGNVRAGINCLHGDFVDMMAAEYSKGNFRPAIINADLTCAAERACTEAGSILQFLDKRKGSLKGPLMVVVTMVLYHRYYSACNGGLSLPEASDPERFMKELRKRRYLQYVPNCGGEMEACTYNGGVNGAGSIMGVYPFSYGGM